MSLQLLPTEDIAYADRDKKMLKFQTNILSMSRTVKLAILTILDLVFLPFCLYLSFCLRISDIWPIEWLKSGWWAFPFVSLVGVFIFRLFSVYQIVLRFAGLQTLVQIFRAVALLTTCLIVVTFLSTSLFIPRSVPLIFLLLAFLYSAGIRLLFRYFYQWVLQNRMDKENIIIYGAGGGGMQIAQALADGSEFKVVAFVDDAKYLKNTLVQGKRVHPPQDLECLITQHNIERVVLAMPSIPRETRSRIVNNLKAMNVNVLTLPSLPEIVTGAAKVNTLKTVEIEDLLGRDPIPPMLKLLQESTQNKSVLISGAGGTIGSEISRQVLKQSPKCLVLLDHSEFNLYSIEQELLGIIKQENLAVELRPVLGSVRDQRILNNTLSRYEVNTFYHAAAYKHVPLVETNLLAGLENNVFGTLNACRCAEQHQIERFVLISTDKAVRPTNVMGATKRVAELITQDISTRSTKTIFSMVRFGNVLGSSGSVIPLFRKQIAKGGPVTVTHPDMTRYFMTISEAAELVIQAGSMAKGGDVFVLDMGEEVKILDMAKQMIRLSGYEVAKHNSTTQDESIEIIFTGLRPGEKIREELLIGNNVTGTRNPRIMRAQEESLSEKELDACLSGLKKAIEKDDCESAIKILERMVTGFKRRH